MLYMLCRNTFFWYNFTNTLNNCTLPTKCCFILYLIATMHAAVQKKKKKSTWGVVSALQIKAVLESAACVCQLLLFVSLRPCLCTAVCLIVIKYKVPTCTTCHSIEPHFINFPQQLWLSLLMHYFSDFFLQTDIVLHISDRHWYCPQTVVHCRKAWRPFR